LRGKEANILINSVTDATTPTKIVDSKTISNGKDGGAFHSIITATGGGGGSNGCVLSITSATITASGSAGRGGFYFCSGTGLATMTLNAAIFDDSKAEATSGTRHGGVFFVDLSNSISLTTSNAASFTN
jgi:hypothetical protein